ncbi:MAG: alpha/beta fold hydrolase [Planctomycetaceae bacterium]
MPAHHVDLEKQINFEDMSLTTWNLKTFARELELPEFVPTRCFGSGMMQTSLTWLKRVSDSSWDQYERRHLTLPISDGTGDCLTAELIKPDDPEAEARPLIVLLHGLGGTSQSVYMRSAALYLCKQGYRVVCLNFRGVGNASEKCDHIHHPGRYSDLTALFNEVGSSESYEQELSAGVILVGFSLGGSVLLNYLAREDLDSRIIGAVSVSAPLDLMATSKCLKLPTRWMFQYYLLQKMKQELLCPASRVTDKEKVCIRNASSVWEFDKTFTAPHSGYDTVEEYYRDNSAGPVLDRIEIPTLLLFSLDDPIVDGSEYTNRNWH